VHRDDDPSIGGGATREEQRLGGGGGGGGAGEALLAIYAPRRALLEVWPPDGGARLAVLSVRGLQPALPPPAAGSRGGLPPLLLLPVMAGQLRGTGASAAGARARGECFLLAANGRLSRLTVAAAAAGTGVPSLSAARRLEGGGGAGRAAGMETQLLSAAKEQDLYRDFLQKLASAAGEDELLAAVARLEGALPRLSALKAIAESQPTHARLNWKAAAVAALELEFACKGDAATAQTRRLLAVLRRREAILHAFCVLSGEAPLPSQPPAVAAAALEEEEEEEEEEKEEEEEEAAAAAAVDPPAVEGESSPHRDVHPPGLRTAPAGGGGGGAGDGGHGLWGCGALCEAKEWLLKYAAVETNLAGISEGYYDDGSAPSCIAFLHCFPALPTTSLAEPAEAAADGMIGTEGDELSAEAQRLIGRSLFQPLESQERGPEAEASADVALKRLDYALELMSLRPATVWILFTEWWFQGPLLPCDPHVPACDWIVSHHERALPDRSRLGPPPTSASDDLAAHGTAARSPKLTRWLRDASQTGLAAACTRCRSRARGTSGLMARAQPGHAFALAEIGAVAMAGTPGAAAWQALVVGTRRQLELGCLLALTVRAPTFRAAPVQGMAFRAGPGVGRSAAEAGVAQGLRAVAAQAECQTMALSLPRRVALLLLGLPNYTAHELGLEKPAYTSAVVPLGSYLQRVKLGAYGSTAARRAAVAALQLRCPSHTTPLLRALHGSCALAGVAPGWGGEWACAEAVQTLEMAADALAGALGVADSAAQEPLVGESMAVLLWTHAILRPLHRLLGQMDGAAKENIAVDVVLTAEARTGGDVSSVTKEQAQEAREATSRALRACSCVLEATKEPPTRAVAAATATIDGVVATILGSQMYAPGTEYWTQMEWCYWVATHEIPCQIYMSWRAVPGTTRSWKRRGGRRCPLRVRGSTWVPCAVLQRWRHSCNPPHDSTRSSRPCCRCLRRWYARAASCCDREHYHNDVFPICGASETGLPCTKVSHGVVGVAPSSLFAFAPCTEPMPPLAPLASFVQQVTTLQCLLVWGSWAVPYHVHVAHMCASV
jgi:hypothetical protein